MWLCFNPDKWFDKEPDLPRPPPDYPTIEGVKPTEPLQPFHKRKDGRPSDDNVWTSDDVRDWTKLGYQYDDLMTQDSAIKNGVLVEGVYQDDLRTHIHSTYSGTSYLAWTIRETTRISNSTFFGKHTNEQRAYEDYLVNVVYD